jgi:hypothetical protein
MASTGETLIQFTIADHVHEGVVSIVGSFNDWTPGIDVFVLRANGTRVADVTVTGTDDVVFRYLGSGGVWLDDPDADEIDERGSVIHLRAVIDDVIKTVDEPIQSIEQSSEPTARIERRAAS